MLTIVIPMAGSGRRFREAGFPVPKPLIPVGDKVMIERVIENLRPRAPHVFVFVCQRQHVEEYGLTDRLQTAAPGSEVVTVDGLTEGAACTVLMARDHIDSSGALMIANCDQFVDTSIDDYLATMDAGRFDGLIMTMTASHPKWSYVELQDQRLVTKVAEKQVISDQATVGIYNFRKGADFVAAAERMIERDERVNGEFYVAPVYNGLIAAGARVGVFNVGSEGNGMYGLGVPEDLHKFLLPHTQARLGSGRATMLKRQQPVSSGAALHQKGS